MSQAITIGGRAALSGIAANLSNVQPFARTEYAIWANTELKATMNHHDKKVVDRICNYNRIPYVVNVKLINTGTGTDKGPLLGGTDNVLLQVEFSEKVKVTGTIATNSVPSIALALTGGTGTQTANVVASDLGVTGKSIINFAYPTAAADLLDIDSLGLRLDGNAIVQVGGSTIKGPTNLPAGLDFANVVFTSMSIN